MRTKVPVSHKQYAHLLTGSWLTASVDLEGMYAADAYFYLLQQQVPEEIQPIHQALISLHDYSKLLAAVDTREDVSGLASTIVDQLEQLPENTPLFLPGGWVAAPTGHAMLYRLEIVNNTVQFSIFNAGAGIKYHAKRSSTDKELHSPVMTWTFPKEQINSPLFSQILKQLIATQVSSQKPSDVKVNEKYLYESIFPQFSLLGGKIEERMIDESLCTQSQISGTCSQSSLNQLLKMQFPNLDSYRIWIYSYKRDTLLHYFEQQAELGKLADPAINSQLQKGIKHCLGLLLLNKEKSDEPLFSKKVVQEDSARLLSCLQQVRQAQKPPQAAMPQADAHDSRYVFITPTPVQEPVPEYDFGASSLFHIDEQLKTKLPDAPQIFHSIKEALVQAEQEIQSGNRIRLMQSLEQFFLKIPIPCEAIAGFANQMIFCEALQQLHNLYRASCRQLIKPPYATSHAQLVHLQCSTVVAYATGIYSETGDYYNDIFRHPIPLTFENPDLDIHYQKLKKIWSSRHELPKTAEENLILAEDQKMMLAVLNQLAKEDAERGLSEVRTIQQEIIYLFNKKPSLLVTFFLLYYEDPKQFMLQRQNETVWSEEFKSALQSMLEAKRATWQPLLQKETLVIKKRQLFLAGDYPLDEGAMYLSFSYAKAFHQLVVDARPDFSKFHYSPRHFEYLEYSPGSRWSIVNERQEKRFLPTLNHLHTMINRDNLVIKELAEHERIFYTLQDDVSAQIPLTLNYFHQYIHLFKKPENQSYFLLTLFGNHALLEQLSNHADQFFKVFDALLQKGSGTFEPNKITTQDFVCFIRFNYAVSDYAARVDPARWSSRLEDFYKEMQERLITCTNPEVRASLYQYLFLSSMDLYQIDPIRYPLNYTIILPAFFQLASPNQFELIDEQLRLKILFQKEVLVREIDKLDDDYVVKLADGVNKMSLSDTDDMDINSGLIFNADGYRKIRVPIALLNYPLFKQLALPTDADCWITKDKFWIIKDKKGNEYKISEKYDQYTIERKVDDQWCLLVPLTIQQKKRYSLAQEVLFDQEESEHSLPLLLDRGHLAWLKPDKQNIIIADSHHQTLVAGELGKHFWSFYDVTNKKQYIKHPPSPFILTQLEHQRYIIYSELAEEYSASLPRYGLVFQGNKLTHELTWTYENEEYRIDEQQDYTLGEGVASLSVMSKTGQTKLILPVQQFVLTTQRSKQSEYRERVHDKTHQLIDDFASQKKDADKDWEYAQTEKVLVFTMHPGKDGQLEPIPTTPAEALYLGYVYLASNQPQKTWEIFEYCRTQLGGLKGTYEELQYLEWIFNGCPRALTSVVFSSMKQDAIENPEHTACRLKALSLWCALDAQKTIKVDYPAESEDQKNLNLQYINQGIKRVKAFEEGINHTLYNSYTLLQKQQREMPAEFNLSMPERKALLDFYHYHNASPKVLGALGYEWATQSLYYLLIEKRQIKAKALKIPRDRERLAIIEAHLQQYTDVRQVSSKLTYQPIKLPVAESGPDDAYRYLDLKKTVSDSLLLQIKKHQFLLTQETLTQHFDELVQICLGHDPDFQEPLKLLLKQALIVNRDLISVTNIIPGRCSMLYRLLYATEPFKGRLVVDLIQFANDIQLPDRAAIQIPQFTDDITPLLMSKQALLERTEERIETPEPLSLAHWAGPQWPQFPLAADAQEALDRSLVALQKEIMELSQQGLHGLTSEVALAAGVISKPTLAQLLTLYLHQDKVRYRLLTQLDDEHILKLHEKLAEYVMLSIQQQHHLRCLENPALAQAVNQVSAHDPPALQLFQYYEELLIRPQQKEALGRLLQESPDGGFSETIEKVIMGGGKSKVLLPLLAQQKAHGDNLVILEVPQALLNTNYADLNAVSCRLFGQSAFKFEFNRDSDVSFQRLEQLYTHLQAVMVNKQYLVTTNDALQSLELKFIECLLSADSSELHRQQLVWFSRIIQLFWHRGDVLIDEVHHGLLLKNKLNYTLGAPEPLPKMMIQASVELFRFIQLKSPNISLVLKRQRTLAPGDIEQLADDLLSDKESPIYPLIQQVDTHNPQEIKNYLLGRADTIPPSLLEHPNKELFAFYKEELGHLLPHSLQRHHKEHYGPSQKIPNPLERALAIPYLANNQPNERSTFGNYLETMNYSIQSLLIDGLSEELLHISLAEFLKAALVESQLHIPKIRLADTAIARGFAQYVDRPDMPYGRLETLEMDNPAHMQALFPLLRHNQEFIFSILKDQILPVIRVDRKILHSDAFNHVTMVRSVQGITGTPWNYSTFHPRLKLSAVADDRDDQALMQTIKAKNTQRVIIDPLMSSADLIHVLFHNVPTRRAIIDVGALFQGIDNEAIAKQIATELKANPDIRYILYFNTNNELCALDKDSEQSLVIGSSDPKVIKQKLHGAEPHQCVTYYDQAHTVGADIPQYADASAAVLIDPKTPVNAFLQGAMRMRQLQTGAQSIDIIGPDIPQVSTLDELFLQLQRNETEQLQTDNFFAARAAMADSVRAALLQHLVQLSDPLEQKRCASLFEKYFVETQSDDFFRRYGGIASLTSTQELLAAYKQFLIQDYQQLLSLEPTDPLVQQMKLSLASIVEKASHPGVCPPQMPSQSQGELDQATETQKEQQQMVAVEQETRIQRGKKSYEMDTYYPIQWEIKDHTIANRDQLEFISLTSMACSTRKRDLPPGTHTEIPLFSTNIQASRNFYLVHRFQTDYCGQDRKPVEQLLFQFNANQHLICTVLTQQEAIQLREAISKDDLVNAWITTTNHQVTSGSAPLDIQENPEYQSLMEQVRFHNGEWVLLMEDESHPLTFMAEEFEEKVAFFNQHGFHAAENIAVQRQAIQQLRGRIQEEQKQLQVLFYQYLKGGPLLEYPAKYERFVMVLKQLFSGVKTDFSYEEAMQLRRLCLHSSAAKIPEALLKRIYQRLGINPCESLALYEEQLTQQRQKNLQQADQLCCPDSDAVIAKKMKRIIDSNDPFATLQMEFKEYSLLWQHRLLLSINIFKGSDFLNKSADQSVFSSVNELQVKQSPLVLNWLLDSLHGAYCNWPVTRKIALFQQLAQSPKQYFEMITRRTYFPNVSVIAFCNQGDPHLIATALQPFHDNPSMLLSLLNTEFNPSSNEISRPIEILANKLGAKQFIDLLKPFFGDQKIEQLLAFYKQIRIHNVIKSVIGAINSAGYDRAECDKLLSGDLETPDKEKVWDMAQKYPTTYEEWFPYVSKFKAFLSLSVFPMSQLIEQFSKTLLEPVAPKASVEEEHVPSKVSIQEQLAHVTTLQIHATTTVLPLKDPLVNQVLELDTADTEKETNLHTQVEDDANTTPPTDTPVQVKAKPSLTIPVKENAGGEKLPGKKSKEKLATDSGQDKKDKGSIVTDGTNPIPPKLPEITNRDVKKARFDAKLGLLKAKVIDLDSRRAEASKNPQKYNKLNTAYNTANNLHQFLLNKGNEYFNLTMYYDTFKNECSREIEGAQVVLNEHRDHGLQRVLRTIADFIKGLGRLFTGKCSFFPSPTESEKKVDDVKEQINQSAPSA